MATQRISDGKTTKMKVIAWTWNNLGRIAGLILMGVALWTLNNPPPAAEVHEHLGVLYMMIAVTWLNKDR